MPDWTGWYQQEMCKHGQNLGAATVITWINWVTTLGGEILGQCSGCGKQFTEVTDMSREGVWNENGKNGGSGVFSRDGKYDSWAFRSWSSYQGLNPPTTRQRAIDIIKKWEKLYGREYALVQCTKCHDFHPSTGKDGWVGDVCDVCTGGKVMKCTKCGVFAGGEYYLQGNGGAYCQKCNTAVQIGEAMKKPMTKGEVRKLPKVNSPMWTDQWSVLGSAKEPYIVSHKTTGAKLGNVTEDGWACSCMAFTRNTPREDCKHILKVKLFEGMSTAAKVVVPTGHAKEYAEFLKLKAKEKRAAAVDGEVKMVGDTTGRKFR